MATPNPSRHLRERKMKMPEDPHPQPENPNRPDNSEPLREYPTEEQMEKVFNAWKKDGKEGIKRALRELYPRTHQKQ
jgi:hypothetical protein